MAINPENLVFAIHRTHDMLRICEDNVFGEYGLTTEHYMVLAAIKHLDSPVRPTDMPHWLTRSVNSVSMIVDRMVKAGLLKRVRDRKDRRTVFLTMTSKAEALFEVATPLYQEFVQRILSRVSPGDQQTLAKLLEQLQGEVHTYSS
jgi:DNA-binding MarR family transcriptional regulator